MDNAIKLKATWEDGIVYARYGKGESVEIGTLEAVGDWIRIACTPTGARREFDGFDAPGIERRAALWLAAQDLLRRATGETA